MLPGDPSGPPLPYLTLPPSATQPRGAPLPGPRCVGFGASSSSRGSSLVWLACFLLTNLRGSAQEVSETETHTQRDSNTQNSLSFVVWDPQKNKSYYFFLKNRFVGFLRVFIAFSVGWSLWNVGGWRGFIFFNVFFFNGLKRFLSFFVCLCFYLNSHWILSPWR